MEGSSTLGLKLSRYRRLSRPMCLRSRGTPNSSLLRGRGKGTVSGGGATRRRPHPRRRPLKDRIRRPQRPRPAPRTCLHPRPAAAWHDGGRRGPVGQPGRPARRRPSAPSAVRARAAAEPGCGSADRSPPARSRTRPVQRRRPGVAPLPAGVGMPPARCARRGPCSSRWAVKATPLFPHATAERRRRRSSESRSRSPGMPRPKSGRRRAPPHGTRRRGARRPPRGRRGAAAHGRQEPALFAP